MMMELSRQVSFDLEQDMKSAERLSKLIRLQSDDLLLPINQQQKSHRIFWYASQRWLIDPESVGMIVWNSFVLITAICAVVYFPFIVAFEPFTDLWVSDVVFTVIFGADMVVTFMTVYRKRNGEVIDNHHDIAIHYLKSWFLLDLIASFPFSVFAGDNRLETLLLRTLKFFAVFRTIKMLKSFRYSALHHRIMYAQRTSTSNMKIILTLFTVLLSCHLAACVWYAIAVIEDDPNSWIYRGFQNANIVELSAWRQYQISLHWALTTITTIGYGDILPFTSYEMIWAGILQFVGAILFSYTTAVIISTISVRDKAERTFFEKVNTFESFCRSSGVKYSTEAEIALFMREKWRHPLKTLDWTSTIGPLPEYLRYKVVLDIFPKIHNAQIICDLKNSGCTEFVERFIANLQPMILTKGEFLVRQNHTADKIFILAKGSIEAISKISKMSSIITYGPGSCLGENFVFLWPYWTHSLRCAEKCQVWCINESKLFELLENNPCAFQVFKSRALVKQKKLREKFQEILSKINTENEPDLKHNPSIESIRALRSKIIEEVKAESPHKISLQAENDFIRNDTRPNIDLKIENLDRKISDLQISMGNIEKFLYSRDSEDIDFDGAKNSSFDCEHDCT